MKNLMSLGAVLLITLVTAVVSLSLGLYNTVRINNSVPYQVTITKTSPVVISPSPEATVSAKPSISTAPAVTVKKVVPSGTIVPTTSK
jgi:anthranilate/para-aminobenzoate synthase component I